MKKREIVETIAKLKTVERIVAQMGCSSPYIEDLAQDIYEALLKKDDKLVESLWEKDQLTFFIIRMVKNNIFSTTSPFYRDYERFRQKADELHDYDTSDVTE